MRKQILSVHRAKQLGPDAHWLNLDEVAQVEITSEDTARPIEDALLPSEGCGWCAAASGEQTIRLILSGR